MLRKPPPLPPTPELELPPPLPSSPGILVRLYITPLMLDSDGDPPRLAYPAPVAKSSPGI